MINFRENYLQALIVLDSSHHLHGVDHRQLNVWPVLRVLLGYRLHLTTINEQFNIVWPSIKWISERTVFDALISYKEKFFPFENNRKSKSQLLVLTNSSHDILLQPPTMILENPILGGICRELHHAEVSFDLWDVNNPVWKYDINSASQIRHRARAILSELVKNAQLTELLYAIVEVLYKFNYRFDLQGFLRWGREQVALFCAQYYFYCSTLQKHHYKVILLYNFYNPQTMALIAAARLNGIKVIEYQHSQISPTHFAYSVFVNICNHIAWMRFIPDHFFVWRKLDSDLLNTYFKDKYNYLITVTGRMFMRNMISGCIPAENQHGLSILIGLQGLRLPDWLIDSMCALDNFSWVLREHPRYPLSIEYRNELEKKIVNCKHVTFNQSGSVECAILNTDCVLTLFSGIAIEATCFNKPVLLFGQDGTSVYSREVEAGLMHEVSDYNSLVNRLNELLQQKQRHGNSNYSDELELNYKKFLEQIMRYVDKV